MKHECKHEEPAKAAPAAETAPAPEAAPAGPDRVILFATSTCPNCKMAKRFLDQAAIRYDVILANEDVAAADLYDIRQAPTLVVIRDGKMEKFVNVSNIRRFIEESAGVPVEA